MEEVLKHFNPGSWQEDLKNLHLDAPRYRGRSYHERKSKGKRGLEILQKQIGMSIEKTNKQTGKSYPCGIFNRLKSNDCCQSIIIELSNEGLYFDQTVLFVWN